MIFHRRPSWRIPEREVTPERVFLNRRSVLAGLGFAGAAAASGIALPGAARARTAGEAWTPAPPTDPAYADAGRAITPEAVNGSYNNFYEFGTHKGIADAAQALPTDPWTISIEGMCAKAGQVGLEDLLAKMPVQERVYRHRCVEAWSMVVPWIGFPLADLVKWAEPTSDAKYVRFETLVDKDTMPGIRQSWYPWPYVEGVTIEEALNPLPFMVTGAYGKVLPKQFGAPIRLHLPWKYGFKSAKSIARISFTDEKPMGFWQELQGSEYGFWANVNPEFSHPRWSQAQERVLGTGDEAPTVIYNGYGEEVAGLYKDMDLTQRGLWF
ncbi:protein-methionine-sulfoxide reductase catalytic subunit MsrP [Albimonas sp. CAU 1670]|uniref:protein-methionine-sulfoxide reductase catalytic subunit MsrP n=1 Tax=Albimonas sp. CAU 1670 TaxID=3032599 RepID=UPI0023DCBF4B|nr:protein-methionine-sulfoxide reductase catalytic subunit MsrP [Albimonas sp. CAU 1670]MDF2233046.1 protein-methionine-sulfoxide reductase catalytic subunit MsrP [Albimonas sp. CAU 1670]